MIKITDKVFLITGSSGNLGSAILTRFVSEPNKFALPQRSPGKHQEKHPFIISLPDQFLIAEASVTNPEEMEQFVQAAINKFGKIDILINTVGGYKAGKPLHKTCLDTWDLMIKLNAQSVFATSHAVIPHMIANNSGKIINIASRAGLHGMKNSSAYSAAKAAVISLSESMAAELKDYEINVNCIIPGTIDTPENREAMPKEDWSKWVSPSAITEVITFLISDLSNAVNGSCIPIYNKG